MANTSLVTGGAGFLGSHLIDRLLARGDSVVCLDNLQTGSLQNLEQHAGNSRFVFNRHDVINPYDVVASEIYNLACPASPILYQKDPIHTVKTSVLGALNAADLALKNQARVFHSSTSEVYGDPLEHPQRESYWGNVNPIGIRSCYDEGKRCAETILYDYRRLHGIDVRMVRIFNTYGPRMSVNDGRVVSNFICQALKGEDITIFGQGEQTRSFCYVDDLLDAFLLLMNKPANSESAVFWSSPVNVGNPTEFTVRELAERVLSLVGGSSKLVFKPLPSDDPSRRRPDIARATAALGGWTPKVSLVDGLKETIRYFRAVLQA